MTKDVIVKALTKATGVKDINLEFTENEVFGDYATNVAFQLKNSRKAAEDIVEKLKNDKELAKVVDKVEVAGPGFINFWLKKDVLVDNLMQIDSQKSDYGKSDLLKNKKYLIEHTSPNPNKALHLGHLRNNVTAMAISNIWEFVGCEVVRDCIDNNRGIAVAKLMWGYLKFAHKEGKRDFDLEYWFKHQNEWNTPEDVGLSPDKFVDDLYVKGSEDFNNPEVEKIVRQMVIDWEAEDIKTWELWKKVLEYSYEGQEKTLKRLGNKWDKVWHEHEHYKIGKEIVQEGLKRGIFKVGKEGAIVTDLAEYRIPDTVVIKSDGTALYITQDLALTKLKKETFSPDKLFWVIGPEQSLALKQMFAVCQQLGIGKLEDFVHIAYGYMSIKGKGKMSSRAGNVIYIDDLLDSAKAKVKKIMKGQSFEGSEMEKTGETVGAGAVKYGILKVGRLQDVAFDIEESVSIEGDSGPYLQYTVARTNSVLAKAAFKGTSLQGISNLTIQQFNNEELAIMRALSRFSEIIIAAAKNYSPNLLCNYLFDLAQKYNNFYNVHRIIGSDNEEFRIMLTAATGQVLKNGLKLLGIETPEKM